MLPSRGIIASQYPPAYTSRASEARPDRSSSREGGRDYIHRSLTFMKPPSSTMGFARVSFPFIRAKGGMWQCRYSCNSLGFWCSDVLFEYQRSKLLSGILFLPLWSRPHNNISPWLFRNASIFILLFLLLLLSSSYKKNPFIFLPFIVFSGSIFNTNLVSIDHINCVNWNYENKWDNGSTPILKKLGYF